MLPSAGRPQFVVAPYRRRTLRLAGCVMNGLRRWPRREAQKTLFLLGRLMETPNGGAFGD